MSTATTTSVSATGAGAGRSAVPIVAITMPVDVVSTELFRDAETGVALNPVQVVFRQQAQGKPQTFLTYTFNNAVISSYQLQADTGGANVQITLGFQSITATFGTGASTSGTGTTPTVPVGWDITTNKAV